MESTLERIKNHFDKHEFSYFIDDEDDCLRSEFTGKNCILKVVVNGDDDHMQVSVMPQIATPPNVRLKVSQLVLERNWILPYGRFDYQIETGRIVFEYALMHTGAINDELIGNMISFSLSVVDDFVPAHAMVSFAEISPSEALQKTEEFSPLDAETLSQLIADEEDSIANSSDSVSQNEFDRRFDEFMKRSFSDPDQVPNDYPFAGQKLTLADKDLEQGQLGLDFDSAD